MDYYCAFIMILFVLFFSSSLCFGFGFDDDEAQTLLTWKNSSTSGFKAALESWSPSDMDNVCTSWYGIRCNSDARIVEITIKALDLQGANLPSNFHSLKSLKTLVLSSTNLSGTIPPQFGDYHQLTFIDLSDNSLSGQIPVQICRLQNLQTLALNTNFLRGQIPSQIGNLSSLSYLTIYDNQLSGEIPISIGKLSRLQVLRAGGNQNLKGSLPFEIGNCTELVMLGVAETSISGTLPISFGMLKNIQTIAIYTTLLYGPIPEDIGDCSELQNLYLYQNSLSGPIPRRIGECTKLQSLLLWQNSLVGTIPNQIGNCQELTIIDLSENLLTGGIPLSFGNLIKLQELQLSLNQLSGTIPQEISNCTSLVHLEVDNNELSGEIPPLIGNLKSLTLFFAWHNRLTGNIPISLSECDNLQALDLSYNHFFGSIPKKIFALRNLTKLLLLSNDLSGFILPDIGNCTNLYRLRLNDNRLSGTIPSEIGNLKSLNFMDLSDNRLIGMIPPLISECGKLEFLDLHSNGLTGSVPELLPKSLQYVDISDNRLTGPLSASIGLLSQLSKLVLSKNLLSGTIPTEILSCTKLILLNLGENGFYGEIPKELGLISGLEISLNLSCNRLSGKIPSQLSGLTKLGILDISHNKLIGDLNILTTLENLVSLNISFNEFSGELPNTPFFQKLPLSDITGNQALYISNGAAVDTPGVTNRKSGNKSTMRLAMSILVSISVVLVLLAMYMLVRARIASNNNMVLMKGGDIWELTFYQKLEFSVDEDIVRNLTSANVIGTGSSGVVYKVEIPNGVTLAVKKMWSAAEDHQFNSEIRTLGSIRHRNIVRLLGWASNRNMKLLFYDYLPNGTLSSHLHGAAAAGKGGVDWESRYDVILGVAHALAYLHHDCVPCILHGDVKAMNVLLGSAYEPYLADFGLATTINNVNDQLSNLLNNKPQLAGSYGYMAPEHGSMQHSITEKSDVYSFGVVILEVLTGRHPLDPTLPGGGGNLVEWVRGHLSKKQNNPEVEILDPKLRGRADAQMHEMLQTLAVSFLCVSRKAEERPMMKDVVAMLKEIRHSVLLLRGSSKDIDAPTCIPTPTSRKIVLQGSSNCSFAFSDDDNDNDNDIDNPL